LSIRGGGVSDQIVCGLAYIWFCVFRMGGGDRLWILCGEKPVQGAAQGVDIALNGGFASKLLRRNVRVFTHHGGGLEALSLLRHVEVDEHQVTVRF